MFRTYVNVAIKKKSYWGGSHIVTPLPPPTQRFRRNTIYILVEGRSLSARCTKNFGARSKYYGPETSEKWGTKIFLPKFSFTDNIKDWHTQKNKKSLWTTNY